MRIIINGASMPEQNTVFYVEGKNLVGVCGNVKRVESFRSQEEAKEAYGKITKEIEENDRAGIVELTEAITEGPETGKVVL